VAVGKRRSSRSLPQPFARGGPVTALVACGGDGTLNLVARAAMKVDLPVGYLPMGKFNDIARFLYDSLDTNIAIEKILTGGYRTLDVGSAANQPFLSSLGVGFTPQLAEELEGNSLPRFGLGWSQLSQKAAANVSVQKTVVKVDAFRFETTPIILNVNLLPYSLGLMLSPASLANDGHAEIIFDHGESTGSFSGYVRKIYKKKYLYGNEVRLYRGKVISWQPMKGRTLYLDGELLDIPTDTLEIKIGTGQLNVFC